MHVGPTPAPRPASDQSCDHSYDQSQAQRHHPPHAPPKKDKHRGIAAQNKAVLRPRLPYFAPALGYFGFRPRLLRGKPAARAALEFMDERGASPRAAGALVCLDRSFGFPSEISPPKQSIRYCVSGIRGVPGTRESIRYCVPGIRCETAACPPSYIRQCPCVRHRPQQSWRWSPSHRAASADRNSGCRSSSR